MPSSERWFWPQPGPAWGACRLLCLPHAGGGALAYRAWANGGIPGVAVTGVELPGRGSRLFEAPFRRAEPLVQALAEVVQPLTAEGPYALFGHSMGALLAFELAHELRQRGAPAPRRLFVSGRRAPHLSPPRRGLHLLPDDELLAEVRRLDGTPQAVFAEPELVQLLLPAMRADFELCDAYACAARPPLTCPITALGGLDDPAVDPDTLDAWRQHTLAGFARQVLPGGHFYLLEAGPAVARIIAGGVGDTWGAASDVGAAS